MSNLQALLLPGLLLLTAGAFAMATPGSGRDGSEPSDSAEALSAQDPGQDPGEAASVARPGASPEDVESIDAILAALYASISGPAGETRDWKRFESLFHPAARLQPIVPTGANQFDLRDHTPAQYRDVAQPIFDQRPFYENELCRRVEQFGQLAHAFSTYESRNDPSEETPFQRGINSIQLMQDGGRWWILSIVWDSERQGNPLPEGYLTGDK